MLSCSIVKEGKSCLFMKKTGCSYNGGKCHSVVDSCNGCMNTEKYPVGIYCQIYAEPALKWLGGECNMASHSKNGTKEDASSRKINPLKASKRSQR